MLTIGVDAGRQTGKGVVAGGQQNLGHATVRTGINVDAASERAIEEALTHGGRDRADVQRIMSTGAGRRDVRSACAWTSEVVSDGKGAIALYPSVRTIVDLGAEECRSIKINAEGRVLDFAKNEKCASGVGIFLESMAKVLESDVVALGELALTSGIDIDVNTTCAVFAESEVVSLVHTGADPADIARALYTAVATRTVSVAKRTGMDKDIMLIGGVAKSIGFLE